MRVWPKSLCVDVEEAGVSILGGGGTSARDTQILLLSGRHTLGDSQIWQDVRTYNKNKKSSCTGKIDWKENMLNKQQCRWNSLQQHEGWPLLKYLAKHGKKKHNNHVCSWKRKKGSFVWFQFKNTCWLVLFYNHLLFRAWNMNSFCSKQAHF